MHKTMMIDKLFFNINILLKEYITCSFALFCHGAIKTKFVETN